MNWPACAFAAFVATLVLTALEAGAQQLALTRMSIPYLMGAVFTEKPLKMYEPSAAERNQDKEPIGSKESPTAGKPYLQLDIARSGSNRVAPLQPITISGRSFPANTSLEIAVDGGPVEKVQVSENGTFTVRIIAPRDFGVHAVTVRDAQTQKVIDGAMFLVVHEDNRKNER
ncbi:MAG: hypothetical protein NVSMB68_12310 [Thermoanaerobaculia bacterium]